MSRVVECACGCGRTGPAAGRGLTSTCYSVARRTHTLGDYPTTSELMADQVAELDGPGVTAQTIADRLGVHRRTVIRYRTRRRPQT